MVLPFIAMIRMYGALMTPISDCDETFNYWEPLHQLMYGRGQQTWEYRCGMAFGATTHPNTATTTSPHHARTPRTHTHTHASNITPTAEAPKGLLVPVRMARVSAVLCLRRCPAPIRGWLVLLAKAFSRMEGPVTAGDHAMPPQPCAAPCD